MKDSRIGVYAVVGLTCLIGCKAALWAAILHAQPWSAIAILALSRAMMLPIMHMIPRARTNGLAVSAGTPGRETVLIGLALAAVLAVIFGAWLAIIICPLIVWGAVRIAQHKIGGQTGDVLGAAQQLAELGALIAVAISLQTALIHQ